MVSKFEQLVQPICEFAHLPLEGTNAKMTSHIGCISPRRQARGRRTLQIPKLTNRTIQDDCTTTFQNKVTLWKTLVSKFELCLICPLQRSRGSLSAGVTRSRAPQQPPPARKFGGGSVLCSKPVAPRPRTALTAVNITPGVARGGFAFSI